jgi:hypothetical protein
MSYKRVSNNIIGEKKQPMPEYPCITCSHCSGKWCNCFNRHVDITFNRCFYHSNYRPIEAVFKVQEGLEQVIEREEAREVLAFA